MSRTSRWRLAGSAAIAAGLLSAGCASDSERQVSSPAAPVSPATPAPQSDPPPVPPSVPLSVPAAPTAPPVAAERTDGPLPSDGTPRRAVLSVPGIDLVDLPVVGYVGWTDDAAGTDIQDGGIAASPHGPRGGVGPGGIGNYQVTAHRNTAGGPFSTLPDLVRGDLVTVAAGPTTYTYRITGTRETSFRSPASLRRQRAAVPGRPGVEATRAMITLSTCATQEDHAQGNYWSDELDNPEHRIDKIGVLVASGPTG